MVNTAVTTINKTGVKYFKKEQDRDYGTNIIKSFVGVTTAGHNVIAVVNRKPKIGSIKVDDFITDSFVQTETFNVGNIPQVI